MSELDPCKFCGSGEVFFWEDCNLKTITSMWYIKCDGCLFASCEYETRAEAIAAWNRKPEPQPITPEALQALGFEKKEGMRNTNYFHFASKDEMSEININFNMPPDEAIALYQKWGGMFTKIVFIPHAKTMQEITNLMRVFLGCNLD